MRRLFVLMALWLTSLAGCLEPAAFLCGDTLCPADGVCLASGCASSEEVAVCNGKAELETCTHPSGPRGACIGGACRIEVCGDGRVDGREACDDGNTVDGDGCNAYCSSTEACGNGYVDVQIGEQCDDGNGNLSRDGCSSSCQLEVPVWREVTPAWPSAADAMVYDTARQAIVLFESPGSTVNVWHWNGLAWVQRHTQTAPRGRRDYKVAYDQQRQRVVLFGGVGLAGEGYQDTWEWDGFAWRQAASTGPAHREGYAMTYHAGVARVLLHGGTDGGTPRDDLWAWDGATWTPVAVTGAAPAARAFHALGYDPQRAKVVLVGGELDTDVPIGEVWELTMTGPTSGSWQQRMETAPAPRAAAGLTFNTQTKRMMLQGGRQGTFWLTELWDWDGTTWRELATDGISEPAIAYDPVRQYALVYYPSTTLGFTDAWLWDDVAWTKFTPAAHPPAHEYGVGAFDESRGTFMLFGGLDPYVSGLLTQTSVYDGNSWHYITQGAAPPSRTDHAMVYDPKRRHIVMFGGLDYGGGLEFNDTWIFDGAWRQIMTPTSPPPTMFHSLGYDAATGDIVLFGGRPVGAGADPTATWTFDGTTWTQRTPPTNPGERWRPAMGYDYASQTLVLVGGARGNSSQMYSDVWEWSGGTWTQRDMVGEFPPRSAAAMYFDHRRNVLAVYGGTGNGWLRQDDWWEVQGQTWVPRNAAAALAAPGTRNVAYDTVQGRLLLIDGQRYAHHMYALTYESTASVAELCHASVDADGDGFAGCDDPDCAGRCKPTCLPNLPCDATGPRCGDGQCSDLESHWICPGDCPSPL